MLDTVAMDGVVVIGEGEKDEAPMLYNGEQVGNGQGPEVDVAVDPLEGTRLTALGQPNAIAVIAVAERGTMFFPGAAVYMDKIAVGPARDRRDRHHASPAENVRARRRGDRQDAAEVDVVVLERDRHDELIAELREAGARVQLIRDGDVAPAIAAAQPGTGVDMLYGIGGTPEGVISAAALKCVGGGIQGRLWPRDDEERQRLVDAGLDPARVLHTNDLVAGEDVFVAATGVTTGALLTGVRYTPGGAATDSIVMRSRSGTVRRIERRQHALEKLSALTGLYASTPELRLDRDRLLLHRRRVRARARGAVQLRAVVVRPLAGLDVLRLAAPRLERRRLQRAAVRERELPRMRAARVHRVQVRGRVLVRLAAGEEDDPGHRRRHVPVEARRASARPPPRRRRGPDAS